MNDSEKDWTGLKQCGRGKHVAKRWAWSKKSRRKELVKGATRVVRKWSTGWRREDVTETICLRCSKWFRRRGSNYCRQEVHPAIAGSKSAAVHRKAAP